MFEVGFLHKIEYVFAVEGDAVDDLHLLAQLLAQRQDLFDVHTFGPGSRQVDAAID